jgi:3-oxoacyl-[acyl-carrier protein] reductase
VTPGHAFVTGAASGIGKAVVARLLAQGWRVTATDRAKPVLAENATSWPSDRVRCLELDVRHAADWRNALDAAEQALGPLDALFNIAGVLRPGWVSETADDAVDLHVDVNLKGTMHGTQQAAAKMVARGKGHIVNVASMAALAPVPGLAHYAASKFGVRAFSVAAALELRPKGVAVSVVCPDAVATPMFDLQKSRAEAALTFSGGAVATADGVARWIVDEVLRYRPFVAARPWHRALLARLGDWLPQATGWLEPLLRRRGLRKQQALRDG